MIATHCFGARPRICCSPGTAELICRTILFRSLADWEEYISLLELLLDSQVGLLFIVTALGLGLGQLRAGGTSIGVAGVLLVGLVMGHFGFSVPTAVLPLGTVFFVTAVGLSAGAGFKMVLRRFGKALILVAVVTLGTGFTATFLLARALGLDAGLATGMMAGALTSTPGLGAALEATAGDPLVGIGYAVAYPIGVLGVIAGINLIARLLPTPTAVEQNLPHTGPQNSAPSGNALSLTIIASLGIIVGLMPVPIPWVGAINLGTAGGPLVVAILLGHFGTVGPLRAEFSKSSLVLLRDLGAVFILASVGTSTGGQFLELVSQHGLGLLVGGLTVTLLSLLSALWVSGMILRTNTASLLGTVSGAMTSTPGLTASIDITGTDEPGLAYAAVYPAAIVLNCVACKILVTLLM